MTRSATVLLAEDEDLLRLVMRETLESNGYAVLEAADGEQALEVAARHNGTIDVLLTDIVMSRMGGRELAQRVRESHPHASVVFMSGYSAEAVTNDG